MNILFYVDVGGYSLWNNLPEDVVEACSYWTFWITIERVTPSAIHTPYSKMAADLCGYKLALVASFKIKDSFEF